MKAELVKISSAAVRLPEVPLHEWLALVQLFLRTEKARFDDPPVWRAPDRYAGRELDYDDSPFNSSSGYLLWDAWPSVWSLSAALHRLSRTPRVLRAALRETRRHWAILHGTVALEHVFAVCVLRNTEESIPLIGKPIDVLDQAAVTDVLRGRAESETRRRMAELAGLPEGSQLSRPPVTLETPRAKVYWLVNADTAILDPAQRAFREVIDFLFPNERGSSNEHPQGPSNTNPVDYWDRLNRPPANPAHPALESERLAAEFWQRAVRQANGTATAGIELVEFLETHEDTSNLAFNFRRTANRKQRQDIATRLLESLPEYCREHREWLRDRIRIDEMELGAPICETLRLIWRMTYEADLLQDTRATLIRDLLPMYSRFNLTLSLDLLLGLAVWPNEHRHSTAPFDDDSWLTQVLAQWTEDVCSYVGSNPSRLAEILSPGQTGTLRFFIRRGFTNVSAGSGPWHTAVPEGFKQAILGLVDSTPDGDRGLAEASILALVAEDGGGLGRVKTRIDPETLEPYDFVGPRFRFDAPFAQAFFGSRYKQFLATARGIDIDRIPQELQRMAADVVADALALADNGVD